MNHCTLVSTLPAKFRSFFLRIAAANGQSPAAAATEAATCYAPAPFQWRRAIQIRFSSSSRPASALSAPVRPYHTSDEQAALVVELLCQARGRDADADAEVGRGCGSAKDHPDRQGVAGVSEPDAWYVAG